MTGQDTQDSGHDFVAPGAIKLSPAALKFAREFAVSIGARPNSPWVVTFDWATSLTVRESPTAEPHDVGPCLTLGAYKRDEVPARFIQTIDGFEFAINVPSSVQANSKQHLIDIDPALLFKLVLR